MKGNTKSLLKKCSYGVIMTALLVGATTACGGGGETKTASSTPNASVAPSGTAPAAPTTAPTTAPTATPKPTETPKPEAKNKPSMSKAEFDKLESGITYAQAIDIIGGPGTVMSESGKKGGTGLEIHTVVYQFEGEGSIGANAILLFQADKMMNKSQMGIK